MISWGIIGCGNVTEVKSGPAFSKVPGSSLVAVMRRNAALAEDYARRHNVPRFYDKVADLINDAGVNAVYIATPPGSHMEYALEVIKARKPVYIEKPMALNYAECMKINRAAEKKNIPVFVAYYRRALPGFEMVRRMISEKVIGKVMFVQMQLFKFPSPDEKAGNLSWRVHPDVSGGGHFFDLASHQLDYLDHLLGPAEEVRSFVTNHGGYYYAEDFVAAEFRYPGNVIVTGTWSFSVSPQASRDTIEIIGDKGTISFSTFDFRPIVIDNNEGKQVIANERPEHVQYFLIEKIVKALEGESISPSTGMSAARTSRVMDEVVKEYYGRHK